MAKRFIDTELFNDSWYMDLSKDAKILWVYLFTKCDHAGVIELNTKLCQFQTGIENLQTVIEQLGNRLVSVKQGYYFIPKFLFFQYPNFPNSRVKSQISALKRLTELNIDFNSYLTLTKDLPKYYGNGNGNVNGNVNGNSIEKIEISESTKIEGESEPDQKTTNLIKQVCDLFGITEMRHQPAFFAISKFIKTIEHTNQVAHFTEQFDYYVKFKQAAAQRLHGWKTYTGTPEQLYADGAWNIENWESKYKDCTKKQPNQQTQTTTYTRKKTYHD